MLVTVTGLIASLKVITTGVLLFVNVEPFAGVTATSVGPVVTGTALALVVKLLVTNPTACPARSKTPPPTTIV